MLSPPTRLIGKLLRGKATPFQIYAACLLGATLGFMPGFQHAPGLVASLLAALLVLNANLFFAGLVGGLSKVLSLALILVGVQFELGFALIEGPLRPLFARLINTPVLALFGFDNYTAVGGLVLGTAVGLAAGTLLVRTIGAFRQRMADLEENSEKYRAWSQKKSIKLLSWALVGGKRGKKSYQDLAEKRVGLPIRPVGVAAAALLAALGGVVTLLLKDSALTGIVQHQAERANGATVDLSSASVDLGSGRAEFAGLAVADRAELTRNVVEADRIAVDFDVADLLTKRLTISEIRVAGAASGTERATPGRTVGTDPAPPPPPPTDDADKTIDDYIKEADAWRKRLGTVRDIIERIQDARDPDAQGDAESDADDDTEDTDPDDPAPDADRPPTERERRASLRERLEQRLAESGDYRGLTASHLVEQSPRVTIERLIIEDVRTGSDTVYDANAQWLTTDLPLLGKTLYIEASSRDGATRVETTAPPDRERPIAFRFVRTGLPAEDALDALVDFEEPPFRGGTLDIILEGTFQRGGTIDTPLVVTLRDSEVNIPGIGPTRVAELALPITLRGPLDNPRVRIDRDDLLASLRAAAGGAVRGRVGDEAEKLLEDAADEIDKAVGDEAGERIREGARGLLDRIGRRGRDDNGGDDKDGGDQDGGG